MSFRIKRDYYDPAEDQTWLGSKHATGDARTVTLDGAEVLQVQGRRVHSVRHRARRGRRRSSSRRPSPAKVDGFLLTSQIFDGGDSIAPLLWHGRIIPERAPEQDVDVTKISNPSFTIVGGTPASDGGNGGAEGLGGPLPLTLG
jgi:hypothetical protein